MSVRLPTILEKGIADVHLTVNQEVSRQPSIWADPMIAKADPTLWRVIWQTVRRGPCQGPRRVYPQDGGSPRLVEGQRQAQVHCR
jgi:hypothetical protein